MAAFLSIAAIAVYLAVWPVPIDPVAWDAPKAQGFVGPFARNERLSDLETLSIGDNHGPEGVAVDANGRVYTGTKEGRIVRIDGTRAENWVSTGGRPLGLRFDRDGSLLVADAYRGLLRVMPDGRVIELAAGIAYANSVDVARDGRVFFTDSSTKFGARAWHGSYEASLLDLLEHGGHGRLLVYDPRTKKTSTVVASLNFPNGVAIAHDGSFVLVVEMGSYRVLRHWLAGPKQGRTEPLLENLPGFPDNLSTGLDGRFWIAFASPRNRPLDALSGMPRVRKMVQRLPASLRPKAVAYGHVVAFDRDGRILASLQDPAGRHGLTTSATETEDALYIGNLEMAFLGVRRPKPPL